MIMDVINLDLCLAMFFEFDVIDMGGVMAMGLGVISYQREGLLDQIG